MQVLCGVVVGGGAMAQPRHFAHFSVRDGLSDSRVQCLLRDRAGFLWVGTAHGLNRFDGHNFRHYLPGAGLPAHSNAGINALAQDAQARLWIATDDGLCLLDTRSGHAHTWRNTGRDDGSLPNSLVRDLLVDAQDRLWVACDNRDPAWLDPSTGRFVRLPFRRFVQTALPQYADRGYVTVERLQAKGREGLWLFSNCGLFDYDFGTGRLRHCPRTAAPPSACAVPLAGMGDALVVEDTCTRQVGFQTFPGSAGHPDLAHASQPYAASGAQAWLLLQGQLWWRDAGNWLPCSVEEGDAAARPVGPVQALLVDAAGSAWIGGAEGLWCCTQAAQRFAQLDLPTVPGSQFTDFLALPTQGRWLALDGPGARLLVLAGEELVRIIDIPQPGTFLHRDRENRIWLGAEGHMYQVDTLAYQLHDSPIFSGLHELVGKDVVIAMGQDRAGRTWLGFEDAGLVVYKPATGTWWHPGEADGFLSESVRGFLPDPQTGDMWVATDDHGLYRYRADADSFVLYRHEERRPSGSLGAYMVNAICLDGKGRLWAATDPGGISRFDPAAKPGAEFQTIGVAEGLPSGRCLGLCRDRAGDLWVTTQAGIAWIDHQRLQVRAFRAEDGLPEGLSWQPQLGADGRIRIGTTRGVCDFHPDSLLRQSVDPRILLCGFRIFDRECNDSLGLHAAQAATLSYRQNFFSVDFASADLARMHRMHYAYRLTGFDADWVDGGQSRIASYTNVPPGSYTLELRSGMDGTWNAVGLSIPIVITPPYWQTWWFRVLAALVIGAVAWGIYRWRIGAIRREAALRNEFNQQLARTEMAALRAQMNPHFVFNCLSSINRFILVNQPEEASGYLTKFARLIRLILDNSRTETVLLSKELEAISLYVEMEQMRFHNRFAFQLELAPDVQPEHIEVPPLLIQPYVENAIWHGLMHKKGEGLLQLRLRMEGQRLCVVVEDDGVGREKAMALKSRSATVHKSHGMKLSSERIAAINRLYGSDAQVETEDLQADGQPVGTRITLRF